MSVTTTSHHLQYRCSTTPVAQSLFSGSRPPCLYSDRFCTGNLKLTFSMPIREGLRNRRDQVFLEKGKQARLCSGVEWSSALTESDNIIRILYG
ncbi:hypothetical protein M758_8G089100 [Ceratodon purpureus]|nr:hypothetical protein M758_8G089100 [Ceratodon purpureus]